MTNTLSPYAMRDAGGLAPMVVILLLSAAFAGCLETFSLNGAPSAKMSIDPSENIRTDELITFSAVAVSYTHLTLPTKRIV